MSESENKDDFKAYSNITAGLYDIYKKNLFNLEKDYLFNEIVTSSLVEGDFKAKPMVLLLGQYSTGKTTFISNLLNTEYCGIRTGAEPTTEKFVAICQSDNVNPHTLPGHAAVINNDLPWCQLKQFGSNFLNRFEIATVNSSLFNGITLIDTPGIYSSLNSFTRDYDYLGVIRWFIQKVNIIIVFFDANKLDMSDELIQIIQFLRNHESKLYIVLNKADMIQGKDLFRVYGALMWNLSRVIETVEIPKIYVVSLWGKPFKNQEFLNIYINDCKELLKLIYTLPSKSAAQKIETFLRRLNKFNCFCLLIEQLKSSEPSLRKKRYYSKVMFELENIIQGVCKKYNLQATDFPDIDDLKKKQNLIWKSRININKKKLSKTVSTVHLKVANLTKLIPPSSLDSPLKIEALKVLLTDMYENSYNVNSEDNICIESINNESMYSPNSINEKSDTMNKENYRKLTTEEASKAPYIQNI